MTTTPRFGSRTVRILGLCVLTILVTFVESGCSGNESVSPVPPPVTDNQWRTVVADWYDDGAFDQTHRCRAVREASRHLPSRSPDMQALRDDFQALEAGAC